MIKKNTKFDSSALNDFQPPANSSEEKLFVQSVGKKEHDLQDDSTILRHTHEGVNSTQINFAHLIGAIKTVAVIPTWLPNEIYEQIVIYQSGTTFRLYCYDMVNKIWRYTALT